MYILSRFIVALLDLIPEGRIRTLESMSDAVP